MNKAINHEKMRVSFDLDEVLFVSPKTHKTEPALRFPLNKFYPERLRLGTPELIRHLQEMGYEVWIYTSSFRTDRYIRGLFRHIDDEAVICAAAGQYGFRAYQLEAEDENWKEKIIQRVEQIKKLDQITRAGYPAGKP